MFNIENKIYKKSFVFTRVTSTSRDFFVKWNQKIKEQEFVFRHTCNPFSCAQNMIPVMCIHFGPVCQSDDVFDVHVMIVSLCEQSIHVEIEKMRCAFVTFTHKTIKCTNPSILFRIEDVTFKNTILNQYKLIDISGNTKNKCIQLWGANAHIQKAISFLTQHVPMVGPSLDNTIQTKITWPDIRLKYSFFFPAHIQTFLNIFKTKMDIVHIYMKFFTFRKYALLICGSSQNVHSAMVHAECILNDICLHIHRIDIYVNELQYKLYSIFLIKNIQKQYGVFIDKRKKTRNTSPETIYNTFYNKNQVCPLYIFDLFKK
jgi:hypothetical protein